VYDAACTLLARRDPRVGVEDVVIPVVGECDDSGLSDPRWARLSDEQVAFAWQQAEDAAALSGTAQAQAPAEGCVGAGTGMEALGFKAGIGTASRILPDGHVMGAVVLANFGSRERLRIAGRRIPDDRVPETTAGSARDRGDRGSCIVVLATNAPLDHHGCTRLARRAGLGLANAGSVGAHGSGEIFLALATGLRGDRRSPASGAPISGSDLDVYFEAAADSTEEAVANSLLAATAMEGREGRRIEALALNRVHRAVH
jgi:D-aminopeptidase